MAKVVNNQNWPRESRYRRLVLPYEKDHVLIECDQSQAEARVVAWKANERTLKELFRSGARVHEVVGSAVMGHKVSKKDTPEEYETAKRIVHGSNYGMKAPTLAGVILKETGVAVPIQECRKRQNVYFQQYPRIKTGYHGAIENELKTNNFVLTTPVGDARKFYHPWGNELFKAAYAHYAQNIVAYITNTAMIKLHDTWMGKWLVMHNHDALMYSLPKSRLSEGANILIKAMTQTINFKEDNLTIPVECKVGENWGEMQEYTV